LALLGGWSSRECPLGCLVPHTPAGLRWLFLLSFGKLTDQLYEPPLVLLNDQWQFAWVLTQASLDWLGITEHSLFGADARLAGSPSQFLLMLTAETGIPVAVLFCLDCLGYFQGVQLLRSGRLLVQR